MSCREVLNGANSLVVYEIALLACPDLPDVIPAAGKIKIRFIGRFEHTAWQIRRMK